MPFSTYLPEHMGSITLAPEGPFVAGSYAELTLVYTAGTFGIDDTGMVKISWRTTSDMSKPQFDKPQAANFTTVEASNGAKLEVWHDRLNVRPYANTLLIRVGRGYLRKGDTLTIRLGDRRQGSPGFRLQTNVEANVELRTSVDAFAAYEFCELPDQPAFDLVPGPAASWKAIVPSLAIAGEPFRLAIVAEDKWGNPTSDARQSITLISSHPVQGLPQRIEVKHGDGPHVINDLVCAQECDLELRLLSGDEEIARANPLRVARHAPLRRYWGDLHGQSGETIGMGTADNYFRFARDLAFIDIVGHQGNDFQITDAFWQELNRLTAAYDAPGKFVCLPGYEWSGNTGMGGDRNVFYRREGQPIRRSSHILVQGQTSTEAIYTADRLFREFEGADAIMIAHVGGRYADVKYAHDGRLERAVEVHSTWGTFEWILHDAFEMGYRVGVVCHSDDHKGRPGATRPGASSFGAIGGLTCYFMPELSRDAVFEALHRRRHYGTTGTSHLHGPDRLVRRRGDGILRRPATRSGRRVQDAAGRHGRHHPSGQRHDAARGRGDRHGADRAARRDARDRDRANGPSLHRSRSRTADTRDVAGRGISRPGPRNAVARQAHGQWQPHRPLCAREFPQPRTNGAGDRTRHHARLQLGHDR